MADQIRDYFCDVFAEPPSLVRGTKDESAQPYQAPFHNNKIKIAWRFLRRNPDGGRAAPYVLLNLTGAALVVKVWATDGTTVLANQSTWAVDSSGTIMTAILDLFTAAMVTAVTGLTAVGQLTTYFEARLTLGDGQIVTYRDNVFRINKALNLDGTPLSTPTESFYSTLISDSRYVRKDGGVNGEFFDLLSANGKRLRVSAVDLADGGVDLKAQEVT